MFCQQHSGKVKDSILFFSRECHGSPKSIVPVDWSAEGRELGQSI